MKIASLWVLFAAAWIAFPLCGGPDSGRIKLYFFGTASGSQPIMGRRHAALALEYNNVITWLDAGEGCSHTASEMGVDLLKVKRIIISHGDSDHVFGLPSLLTDFCEVERCLKRKRSYRATVYAPRTKKIEALLQMLIHTSRGGVIQPWFDLRGISDGLLFEGDGVKVEARHNKHLGTPADGRWKSFSFRITVAGKTIIYAGDYNTLDDFGDWITTTKQPADVLLIETGHNHADAIAKELRQRGTTVKELIYVHHGPRICKNPERELVRAEKAWGKSVIFSCDKMVVIL